MIEDSREASQEMRGQRYDMQQRSPGRNQSDYITVMWCVPQDSGHPELEFNEIHGG